MTKLPVSVFIVTLNEEKNIARALDSIGFAEEIIVVDSGSTDSTLDIVRSYGIEPIHNDWSGYAAQKQFALDRCHHEWVLNIDADEEISKPLANRFKEVIEQNKYSSVRCLRTEKIMGKYLSNWTKKPNNRRFYKRLSATFDETRLVHESAKVDGEELFVSEELIHHGYSTIEILTDKKNQYSSLKAKEKFLKNKRFSLAKLLLIFPLVFIQELFFKRKIFSGTRGVILSVIAAHYAFIKEAKLFEYSVKENSASSN